MSRGDYVAKPSRVYLVLRKRDYMLKPKGDVVRVVAIERDVKTYPFSWAVRLAELAVHKGYSCMQFGLDKPEPTAKNRFNNAFPFGHLTELTPEIKRTMRVPVEEYNASQFVPFMEERYA